MNSTYSGGSSFREMISNVVVQMKGVVIWTTFTDYVADNLFNMIGPTYTGGFTSLLEGSTSTDLKKKNYL